MAKVVKKKSSKIVKKQSVSPFNIYWEKSHYYLFGLGILLVIIGFYVMSIGQWDSFESLVISPILLFLGYVVIFPLSILFKKKKSEAVPEVLDNPEAVQ